MENEGGFFDIDEFVVETKSHENKLKFQKKDKKKKEKDDNANSNSKRKAKEQEEEKEDEFESNTNYNFDDEKKQYMEKLSADNDPDRSRAGKADAPIIPLLDMINSKKDFFTTSSCAGRIIITQVTKLLAN